jgi:putative two-component system response regulator
MPKRRKKMVDISNGEAQDLKRSVEEAPPEIMIVDDDDTIRRILSKLMSKKGMEVTLAADAAVGRKFIKSKEFDLVLCDINMPGESGIEFIRYLLTTHPNTAVVMMTGLDDPQVAEAVIDIGIYAYIIKPFRPKQVVISVVNALRQRELEMQNRLHRKKLELLVAKRTDTVRKTMSELKQAMVGIVEAMAKMVEQKDPYTAGRQKRVSRLATAIAGKMKLDDLQIECVRMAGFIHDIGKIGVPVEILNKPGKLNRHEFAIIQSHVQIGYDILKNINFPWPIAQAVYQHHERFDGSGYPRRLAGEDICTEAKIIGVADTIEAMSSNRSYRSAPGIGNALDEIKKHRNELYDPLVCNALFDLTIPEIEGLLALAPNSDE